MNNILTIIGFTVVAVFLFWYSKVRKTDSGNNILWLPFGLVIGGACSNLVDRITQGFVTDFIDFHFWPAFNIADSAITIGVVILIIHNLRKEE